MYNIHFDFEGGDLDVMIVFPFFTGYWNDNNCGLKFGYVCKKPVSGRVVIPSPSPYPPGGCANGFTRVPGGRKQINILLSCTVENPTM